MSVINTMFEIYEDDIIRSLGNTLISGNNDKCKKQLFFDILKKYIDQKKTIIFTDGCVSRGEYDLLNTYIKNLGKGMFLKDFLSDNTGDNFDALSAFETNEDKIEFITFLFKESSEISSELLNKIRRYYGYILRLLSLKDEKINLKDILLIDVDEAVNLIEDSYLEEPEKRRMHRFMTDSSIYCSYLEIEDIVFKLENNGIIKLFSGDMKAKEIYKNGNIILALAQEEESEEKRRIFVDSFLYISAQYINKKKTSDSIAFINKNIDFVNGEIIEKVFDFNNRYNIASYIFIEDVSKFINNIGNKFLDDIMSCIVFLQGSDTNAEFWSNYFGNKDSLERNYSYTKKKGWNPFSSVIDSGGVVASNRKYNSYTQSFQKVNKPLYRKEVFRELRVDEAMIYLNKPLKRKKIKISL